MNIHFKPLVYSALAIFLLFGCGSVQPGIISTPVENIDAMPIKVTDLSDAQKKNWSHLDLVRDTIPGMSVDKAYEEIIKNKKGQTTIVAIIDSGIDIDHEDLKKVIWTNPKEIANNGKDDDGNGYIDDIHGWNFLGDGYNEQLEYVRLLASGDTSNPRYAEAQKLYNEAYQKNLGNKTQYEQIMQQVNAADDAVSKYLKKKVYTKDEVSAIKTEDAALQQAVATIKMVYGYGFDDVSKFKKELNDGLEHFTEQLNYNLNKDLKGRKTGDNPNVLNDKPGYGNGNIKPSVKTESHGTHVAGIIAAERKNGKGVDGVANNVKIMVVRTVPNGDEYDKDVANAIRYAVDNGAKVINGSFGKSFSPHAQWVYDAIKYASDKDVVIVVASGNDGENLDQKDSFPNDAVKNGNEVSNTFISVGSLESVYGSKLISSFSNYGKINIDVFAPGGQIYSPSPGNEYEFVNGTSFASPGVAGLAALIRSQYPSLKAAQVKDIILKSGLPLTTKVIVGGDPKNVQSFTNLSTSGRIANTYNALIMASEVAKKK
ncbi:MAG: S8 family peptidase [Aquaticitalea sp.]